MLGMHCDMLLHLRTAVTMLLLRMAPLQQQRFYAAAAKGKHAAAPRQSYTCTAHCWTLHS